MALLIPFVFLLSNWNFYANWFPTHLDFMIWLFLVSIRFATMIKAIFLAGIKIILFLLLGYSFDSHSFRCIE